MFKIESYITPIILSYVNRYINNFKTEDSQVSLWGGDATFHNLELNLEVLEQELQLPFSFVSGSIRELSIHVPWTKIASEPIRITINTIECILNLKGKNARQTPQRKKAKEKVNGQSKNVEAPPGYIQSLINKIVSNISIHCNNLILKYVEEDIVLSMNVKLLKFESADEKWEPAYTDLSPAQVILRKIISVIDLTLCLDKRNASGKIEVYQEPMLYRCSMTMHLLRHYHSATANMASTTRLDVYCNNMEFSMTEQQVPMLMRLLILLYALQQKQLKPEKGQVTDAAGTSTDTENQEDSESWTGWAWSYVSSVLPTPWDDEWDNEELKNARGHALQIGFYVDRASITFKISEATNERGYYTHKKLRYWPMLTLDLQGIYSDTIIHELTWFNCSGGVSEATLTPVGYCSCGQVEVNESTAPYVKLGSPSNFHKSDSLFDADAIENKGGKRQYNTSWEHHMAMNTESVLLERTPAFAYDYVYQIEIPNDMSSDVLSEMGSNYEFSNLSETSVLRLCIGPFRLRVCSGLFHRLSTLETAGSFYDYPPYYTPKPDLPLQDLLPPSEEDFDALSEFIPGRSIRMTFFAPTVELELMDHPFFEACKGCLFKRPKKPSISYMSTSCSIVPKITIECQFIDIGINYPMYVDRLVHTTCQLPEPPRKLFEACYTKRNVKVVGLLGRLVTNPACQSIILTPSSISYSTKSILKPQYWTNSDIPHDEVVFESENLTLNGTKAKMLVVYNIVEKMLLREPDPVGKSIYSSTLLTDACRDYGFPYMEICIEGIRFKKVATNSTLTIDISLESIKAFIFEPVDSKSGLKLSKTCTANTSIQQVLFISGPEPKSANKKNEAYVLRKSTSEDPPLLTVTIQFPISPDLQKHAPILIFNLQEIRICIDPLLCKWLLYVPKNFLLSDILDTSTHSKTKSLSEASGSIIEMPRKLSANQLESIHSSSDREPQKLPQKVISGTASKDEYVDVQEKVYNVLKKWFDVWKGMFLCGDISQCTIYFPMVSLSAVGSQGIQEAVEQAVNKDNPPDIMVITLPFANIRSAQRQNVSKYLRVLPVTLPDNIWSVDKSSFPWTMSISELSCYTIQHGNKLIFLKPVSLSATVGLSTRPSKSSTTSVNTQTVEKEKEKTEQGAKKKTNVQSKDLKRKGSRNTNQSTASSSKAQLGRNSDSSTPTSPNSQTKRSQKGVSQTQIGRKEVATAKVDIGYLGVCVHIDMTPVVISTSEVQVYLFASILYGLMEVASNLLPSTGNRSTGISKMVLQEAIPPVVTKGSSTLSPTIRRENTVDSASERTPPLSTTVKVECLTESDSVKLTAWVQWTITRFTMELLSSEYQGTKPEDLESLQPRLKLVVDAEDIVSSLDFQSIYLKVKSKIGSASIRHYERASPNSQWQPGPFSGIVMRLRDDLSSNQRQEDNSLISITITRASCQHTHTLWGAVQQKNKDKKPDSHAQLLSKSRYITEIVVNIQPLDFIISLSTLRSFYLVLIPLLNIPVNNLETQKIDSPSNGNYLTNVNNQTLPLAYLDCQDIRVIMPSKDLLGSGTLHDVMVFQVLKIRLNPQAVNPICRTPIRSDLYDQAAHARILNIPGSEVEDRQYQLDVMGISVCTGIWEDINSILSPNNNGLSNLRGMSENPALEWNILEQGQPNMTPMLNLRCVVEKFDTTIVAAPSMVYKENITVCGHAVEVNLVSDIFINLSLHQIKLLSALLTEFVMLVTPLIKEDGVFKRPKIKFPYSRFKSNSTELVTERVISTVDGLNRDSGIETSDVKSVQSAKVQGTSLITKLSTDSDKQIVFPRPPNTVPYVYSAVPLEVVWTAGKIVLSLYSVEDERSGNAKHKGRKKKISKKTDDDQGYEASEESTDDRNDYKKYIPLLYVCFTQPNAFLAKQQLGRKVQVSCFDVNFRLSGPEYSPVNHLPTECDFPVNLLETKPGSPNPNNGILPAFFTLRFTKGIGKNSKIELEIEKPTKILCQTSKWGHLLVIKDKVVDTFRSGGGSDSFTALMKAVNEMNKEGTTFYNRNIKTSDTYSKFQEIKEFLGITNSVTAKFDQVIFVVTSENGHELHIGMQKLNSQLSVSTRPEKLCLMTTFSCLTLTVMYESFKKLLLNPWTVTFDVCIFWESWQDVDSDPQIQIMAESDCILLDVTAEQIQCVEMILKDVNEFVAMLPSKEKSDNIKEFVSTKCVDRDQHYKDDLRAGAFQFIDSSTDNTDEMPLPYQVMFWTKNISAMAWKYPQPRALTKVRVFPVPYKMALGSPDNILVLCHLEYWSECRNCYLPYTQFYLSESEVCHLNLPKGCPKTIVASTWRVVITTIDEKTEEPLTNKGSISARALAACMRIDSYFNRSLIPNFNVALYITKLELSFYNYISKYVPAKLPECLKKYNSDLGFTEIQRFLTLSLNNLCAYVSMWSRDVLVGEVSASINSNVLDYAFLTEQTFVEPFTSKLEFCLSNGLQCNFISKPIQLKFGPSIAHTLAVSSQIWTQNHIDESQHLDFIIVTRYVICNDTNVCLRFGQTATDENLLIPSRGFHLYAWRSQKKKQQFRVGIEETDWLWSKSFTAIEEGTQMIHFNTEKNITIFISVKNLSKTQRQVTFFGQLIVCNMLGEHFEMKVIEAGTDNKEQEFKNAQCHIVTGRSAAPSIFVNNRKNYFLRLRFYGLDAAWTGDIPLREHATASQPWLVKVPLQERGQFLSIWCKIFVQEFQKTKRILAMLWPLFMVKSNLPMSAKVHIETPILGVHLDSVVNGKGELQQLYCPGTIDHSHQITFQLEDGNSSVNNPYVPLNYSLVDQQKFFKKSPKEEIEVILESLNHCFETKWPYFGDEFDNIDWIVDDSQPLTHVQVRYQNACQYSCALLVELLPWCLIVNTLGTAVSIMLNGVELCRVQHHGIMAPPRLEENFHLGVCSGSNWFFSGPLQLAKSDWTQSFYMPKIAGNIPLDGTIKTCIKCDSHLCMISITSSISNEIRLLRLSSTHILSNHLSTQIHVICFAVPEGKHLFDMPKDVDKYCFTVAPHLQKSHSGIPIMQWYMLKPESESVNADYCLYITFSVDPKVGWSCPIKINKPLVRKGFSVQAKDLSIAVVLTARENDGQVFLAIHYDPRPQLFIENKTKVAFYCGQSLPDDTGVIKESENFRWNCKVEGLHSVYYNMPVISETFPELPQVYFSEKISLAYDFEDNKQDLDWSAGVSIINNNDLFIRVPYYGDVKLTIVNTACTTILIIESVSQVEISARDIRVRLSLREMEKQTPLSKGNKELEALIRNTNYDTTDDVDSCLLSPSSTTSSLNMPPSFQKLPTVIEQAHVNPSTASLKPHSPRSSLDKDSAISFRDSKSLLAHTLPLQEGWNSIKVNVYVKSFGMTLITDTEEEGEERWELASLTCDDIILTANQTQHLKISLSLSDIQLDNQLFTREPYDFPVVLIGQEKRPFKKLNILSVPIESLLENCQQHSLIVVDFILESWTNDSTNELYTGIKTIKISINPISSFIEDIYVTRLMQYLKNFNIIQLVLWPNLKSPAKLSASSTSIIVPELISWQCAILAQPLTVRTFVVSPVSMLLSVHSSVKLYIALDQSPLQFSKFERRRLFTTPYRLGHALTMHYLSGAIFGAGWVVSSLELLGSPGGLARAMGTGLRDFVSLPYRGLVQGPMAFLKGITTGSASLMKHVTAGTLQSVTKLASSVARNLDRLTLDEEHQKRTEEQRRQRPQGVAQGFMQGMTSFGISLLGALGGIAHHPLQSVMSGGASPRSLAAGVGLGLVGVFTKPLSGAAELVAMTGQGLLQGAGWNPLPDPRSRPQTIKLAQAANSNLKYPWKFISLLHSQMLYVTEATCISHTSIYASVALILTTDSVIVINLDSDDIYKVISLSEISILSNSDPTVLSLKHTVPKAPQKDTEKIEDELEVVMDPGVRARVADYVQSTIGLLNLPRPLSAHSEISVSPLCSPGADEPTSDESTILNFYVSSQKMKYFTCLLNIAKQQNGGNHFPVL